MHLAIRSSTRPLPEDLARHAERSVGLALGRFGERVSEVDVWLQASPQDDPGPGAPGEVRCLLRIELDPRGELTFRSTHVDPFVALTHAARRASAGIARHLGQSGLRRTGRGS